jgi:hypothetical protein
LPSTPFVPSAPAGPTGPSQLVKKPRTITPVKSDKDFKRFIFLMTLLIAFYNALKIGMKAPLSH